MHTAHAHAPARSSEIFYLTFLLLFGLMILPGIGSDRLMAQGNLLITPRRVVFEGPKRIQDLNLANTGSDTATYQVSLRQYRMKEDGSFEEITEPDPGQYFADKNVRIFPRTVTLAPNEAQVVKLQLFRSNELKPGEYRSHLYFRAIPKEGALGENDNPVDSSSLSVRLTPIFGISIPVIIRIGESDTRVTLTGLSFQMVNDTIPQLNLAMNRSGNMSVYGDIEVSHVAPSGNKTVVGIIRGIAVYTPNPVRKVRMDLFPVPGLKYNSGKLQVVFSGLSDTKPVKYADAELILQ
jgi:P pilus assembly chaperone PapD